MLRVIVERCRRDPVFAAQASERDIYQFGVYTGRSMLQYVLGFNQTGVAFGKMWGFDSFEGIPKVASRTAAGSGETLAAASVYQAGTFNAAEALGLYSYSALIQQLNEYIGYPSIGWIRGFFSTSLTNDLAQHRRMAPALVVDIDTDIFESAYQALDWLVRNGLIRPGTFVGYDEYQQNVHINGSKGVMHAERDAHDAIMKKHGIKFGPIHRNGQGAWFEVLSLGSTKAVR